MVLPLPGQVNGKVRAKTAAFRSCGDNTRVCNNLQDMTDIQRKRPRTIRCEACSKSSVADGYGRDLFGECLGGVDAAAGDDFSAERIDLIGRCYQSLAERFDRYFRIGGDHQCSNS